MAGDEGFEPPITGPEPVALPLGQSPILVAQSRIILENTQNLKQGLPLTVRSAGYVEQIQQLG